jgi:hypothetical protein
MAPTRTRHRNNISTKAQKWTTEEDNLLTTFVKGKDKVNWNEIAKNFSGKSAQQALERWTKVLDPTLTKGSWTRQEDETITNFVKANGTKSWTKLAELLPGRIGKQCRERWINHLDPDINRGPWTAEEDAKVIELHNIYGNKWVKISAQMPHRSDNSIKNRWNSTLSKRDKDKIIVIPASADQEIPKPLLASNEPPRKCLTPIGINLISPLIPNPNYILVSPFLDTPQHMLYSPTRNSSPSSLSENRQELFNLLTKQ